MTEKRLTGDEVLQVIFAVYATGMSAGVTRTEYDKLRDAILDSDWLKNNGKITSVESLSEFIKHGSADFRFATDGGQTTVFRSANFVPLFFMDGCELRADSAHRIYDKRLDSARYDSQVPYDVITGIAHDLFSIPVQSDPYGAVNTPSHYAAGGIECIDALRSALGNDGFASAMKFNIMKYLWRADHKNGAEDVNKALYYMLELMYLIPDGRERIENTVKTVASKHAK